MRTSQRRRKLMSELSLSTRAYEVMFFAYALRVQSALPEDDRCMDIQKLEVWLKACRSFLSEEAQILPDRLIQ